MDSAFFFGVDVPPQGDLCRRKECVSAAFDGSGKKRVPAGGFSMMLQHRIAENREKKRLVFADLYAIILVKKQDAKRSASMLLRRSLAAGKAALVFERAAAPAQISTRQA